MTDLEKRKCLCYANTNTRAPVGARSPVRRMKAYELSLIHILARAHLPHGRLCAPRCRRRIVVPWTAGQPDQAPVSYTHLDVYKRQGQGIAFARRVWVCRVSSSLPAPSILPFASPVSYTHLDVYKRQTWKPWWHITASWAAGIIEKENGYVRKNRDSL